MYFLGIETTCDETAMAVINGKKEVKSHVVFSQIDLHKIYGGVIPELAARNHLSVIDKVLELTLVEAGISLKDLEVIGATAGPGLIGGVMVGTVFAKTLCSILNKKFVAVNHLEGHALVCNLNNNIKFPFLLLLLSGGHCQILRVDGVGKYKKIGETMDDALGECFDKVGKMLNLEYPAGPKIEEMAKYGDINAFSFTCPLINSRGIKNKEDRFNFSFSGLKTAVKIQLEKLGKLTLKQRQNVCASFQNTVVKILNNRLENVLIEEKLMNNIDTVVISGGVSANQYIKENLLYLCKKYNKKLITPPVKLCTDNGVMIANVVLEKYKLGEFSDLSTTPLSRWELEDIC